MKKSGLLRIISIILIIINVTAIPVTAKTENKAYASGSVAYSNSRAIKEMKKITLTKNVKKAQKALISGIKKMKSSIDISKYKIPRSSVSYFYMGTVYENPEMFWAMTTFYYYYRDGYVTKIQPDYHFGKSELSLRKSEFNYRVNAYLSSIQPDMSDYDKALVLHDKLVSENAYNSKALRKYCSYGALYDCSSVCQGYALAYAYLLNQVGIGNHIAYSENMDHVWNIVKIGGKWYHVDATWDDQMLRNDNPNDTDIDFTGRVLHKFFLISSKKIQSFDYNHYDWLTFFKNYNCTSEKYNNSFDKNINTKIVKIDNSYYYAYKNTLYKKTGSVATACSDKKAYTIDRVRNYIYFNDDTSLYYYDINTNTVAFKCQFNVNSDQNYVKGISIIDKTVYYLQATKNKNSYTLYYVNNITFPSEQVIKIKTIKNIKKGIKLQWNSASGAEKYEIYRKKGNGKYTLIKTVYKGTTSYTDKKVKNKTKYYYYIKTAPQRVSSLAKSITRKK